MILVHSIIIILLSCEFWHMFNPNNIMSICEECLNECGKKCLPELKLMS